jgi:hypothetical protein
MSATMNAPVERQQLDFVEKGTAQCLQGSSIAAVTARSKANTTI